MEGTGGTGWEAGQLASGPIGAVSAHKLAVTDRSGSRGCASMGPAPYRDRAARDVAARLEGEAAAVNGGLCDGDER